MEEPTVTHGLPATQTRVLPGNLPWGFPDSSGGKEPACHAGHPPSLGGEDTPGEGNGNLS